jgi:hypothetical protein
MNIAAKAISPATNHTMTEIVFPRPGSPVDFIKTETHTIDPIPIQGSIACRDTAEKSRSKSEKLADAVGSVARSTRRIHNERSKHASVKTNAVNQRNKDATDTLGSTNVDIGYQMDTNRVAMMPIQSCQLSSFAFLMDQQRLSKDPIPRDQTARIGGPPQTRYLSLPVPQEAAA